MHQKIIQNIQGLRGIAVLLVVIYHLVIIEKKYGGTDSLLPEFLRFGMSGVDLFFVISGFVMVSVTQAAFQSPKSAMTFLYRRVSRIYPLYWVYTVLVLIVFLVKPSIVNSSVAGEVNILASFLLLPSETLPLLVVGWTLIHEMYFYLMFFLMILLLPKKHLPLMLVLWAIGIALLNLFTQTSSPIAVIVTHPLTIEFIGGALLATAYYRKNLIVNSSRSILLLFGSLITSAIGYAFYIQHTGLFEPAGWWRVALFGAPAILVVFSVIQLERNSVIIHSALIKMGDASYSIYLSHILTLSFAGRFWSQYDGNGLWDHALILPIMLLAVLAVGFISHAIIEKPLIKFSRRIVI